MKKIILQVLLAGLIVFLAYKCYNSIMIPERFKEIKNQRYEKIVQRLKDIRTAEIAFKDAHGRYTADFDSLINFIKFDSVKLVRSIGSLSDDQLEAGMTEAQAIKEGLILRDTLRVSALENIFGKDYQIDNIRFVPFTNRKHQFFLGTSSITTDAGVNVPVFEAHVSNMKIFEDLSEEYNDSLREENGERLRLKKYPGLKVGDLKEANNNVGNWE